MQLSSILCGTILLKVFLVLEIHYCNTIASDYECIGHFRESSSIHVAANYIELTSSYIGT